ncbi:hypothetical protein [Bacillus sp. FSL R5-0677]|uniref:hypothetical protein n=1 Tax=Bacillus sp. FSL R5-0677 TaxID=2921581 RepID=UPI0030F90C64
MEQKQLFEALDGLFAFDNGCIDSGIRDEQLRFQVCNHLEALDENEFRVTLSTFVRQYFVSEERIEKGYGIEDVAKFIRWIDGYMNISL